MIQVPTHPLHPLHSNFQSLILRVDGPSGPKLQSNANGNLWLWTHLSASIASADISFLHAYLSRQVKIRSPLICGIFWTFLLYITSQKKYVNKTPAVKGAFAVPLNSSKYLWAFLLDGFFGSFSAEPFFFGGGSRQVGTGKGRRNNVQNASKCTVFAKEYGWSQFGLEWRPGGKFLNWHSRLSHWRWSFVIVVGHRCVGKKISVFSHQHYPWRIHVRYIYLLFVDVYGKCR